jgi:hypothetical protein
MSDKLTFEQLVERRRLNPQEFSEYLAGIHGERAFARAYAKDDSQTVEFLLGANIPLHCIGSIIAEGDTGLLDNLLRHYERNVVIDYITDILDLMLEAAVANDASATIIWLFTHVPKPAFAELIENWHDFSETLRNASAAILSTVVTGLKRHELFATQLIFAALVNSLKTGALDAVTVITDSGGKDLVSMLAPVSDSGEILADQPHFFGSCHAGCLAALLDGLAPHLPRPESLPPGATPLSALLDAADWLGRAASEGADALCELILARGASPCLALRFLFGNCFDADEPTFLCLTWPGDQALRRCLDSILQASHSVGVSLAELRDAPAAQLAVYAEYKACRAGDASSQGLSSADLFYRDARKCGHPAIPLPITELFLSLMPAVESGPPASILCALLRGLADRGTPSLKVCTGVSSASLLRDDPAGAAALSLSWLRSPALMLFRNPVAAGEAFAGTPLMQTPAHAPAASSAAATLPCPVCCSLSPDCVAVCRALCTWSDVARACLIGRFLSAPAIVRAMGQSDASTHPDADVDRAVCDVMRAARIWASPNVLWVLLQLAAALGIKASVDFPSWEFEMKVTGQVPVYSPGLFEEVFAASLWVAVTCPHAAAILAPLEQQEQEALCRVDPKTFMRVVERAASACARAPLQRALSLAHACAEARGAPPPVECALSGLRVYDRVSAAESPARVLAAGEVVLKALTASAYGAYGPEHGDALLHIALGFALTCARSSPLVFSLAAQLIEAGADPGTGFQVPFKADISASTLRRLLAAARNAESLCARRKNAVERAPETLAHQFVRLALYFGAP